jgi:hypothetical protein
MYMNKIKVVLGKLTFSNKAYKIFDISTINFLDKISQEIIKNKEYSKYTDIITFAFFIRKKNLIKISREYKNKNQIIGRGSAFHVAPSNIPINFAYSLVFGLLSGNNNIVRLPSKNFIQTNILCKIFYKIIKKKKYLKFYKRICLIKYEKSDEISSELSIKADARIIWGGDETINQFQKYPTSPRCINLNFANRYSISVINVNKLAKLSNSNLKNIVNRFYNDSYTMDQKACSSPQALVWIGYDKKKIKEKFVNILSEIVDKKYGSDLSVTNSKIYSLSSAAIKSEVNFKSNYKNFNLIKIKLEKLSQEIEKIHPHFGTFIEININNINQLNKIITKKLQTITYYGIEKKKIHKLIFKYGILGVDRIVPIGRAFDIGLVWDGYDVIQALSRIIGD